MSRPDAFDPKRIIETLDRHRVAYVLVGGYAAQLYGARRPTYDIDIAPSTALGNLHRLSQALREPGAGIRVDDIDEGLPFDSSAESLRGMQMLNLRTPLAISTSHLRPPVFRTATTACCRAPNRTASGM